MLEHLNEDQSGMFDNRHNRHNRHSHDAIYFHYNNALDHFHTYDWFYN